MKKRIDFGTAMGYAFIITAVAMIAAFAALVVLSPSRPATAGTCRPRYDYNVIVQADPHLLRVGVEKMGFNGYELVGGIAADNGMFYQAMVKIDYECSGETIPAPQK